MLQTERYAVQSKRWPASGRHILAQADSETVLVYQAYRPSIGLYAARHGHLGKAQFGYSRMSWIKPGFLWMMYRSSWGTKPNQEITLAIWIRRGFFDSLVAQAVASSFSADEFSSRDEWQQAVAAPTVRVQWDPDRTPQGQPLDRRALQLGLRGQSLEASGKQEILEIANISSFVAEQRTNANRRRLSELLTPVEDVYNPDDPTARARLQLGHFNATTSTP